MQRAARIHARRAMQDDHRRYRARTVGRQRQHSRNPNRYRLAGGWQWLTIERDKPFADSGNGAAIGGGDLSPGRCERKRTAQHQADGHYFEHLVTPERHERVLNLHPLSKIGGAWHQPHIVITARPSTCHWVNANGSSIAMPVITQLASTKPRHKTHFLRAGRAIYRDQCKDLHPHGEHADAES